MTRFFSATRHGIPLLALAMLGFGGWSVASKYQPRVVTPPPIAAPTSPYDDDVAGSGIIEPASEVIALATERGGVVTRVAVIAGDSVRAGEPLFSIDDRNYRATVAQDEATVASTTASLAAIDQSLVLQGETIDQARANLQGVEAERTSSRMLGQHTSALRPPQQMPKKQTRALQRQRLRWPAHNSRCKSSWRNARTQRRSMIRQ